MGLGPWALALGGAFELGASLALRLALAWPGFSLESEPEGLLGACASRLPLPSQTFVTVASLSHTLYSAFYVMLLGARCLGGLGSCVGEGVAR